MLYLKEYAKGVSKQSLKLTIHYFLKYMKYLMYRNLHFFLSPTSSSETLLFRKNAQDAKMDREGTYVNILRNVLKTIVFLCCFYFC